MLTNFVKGNVKEILLNTKLLSFPNGIDFSFMPKLTITNAFKLLFYPSVRLNVFVEFYHISHLLCLCIHLDLYLENLVFFTI